MSDTIERLKYLSLPDQNGYRERGADLFREAASILEDTRKLLFRVVDEQVPLFSSERLKTLHGDARKLLDRIDGR